MKKTLLTLAVLLAIPTLVLGADTFTPTSWTRSVTTGYVRPNILTDTLRISSLTNCDTIDTDADGDFSCGTDGGGGGTPGGSTTQVQYNNAGAFGGITGATTNGTVLTLTSPVINTSLNSAYATASTIGIFDGSKNLISASTSTYPGLTEFSYLKGVTSAIQTQFTGKLGTTLTSANFFVGNGSNVATGVAMSGDATLANTGAVTVVSASDTTAGKVELATISETNTGTDTTRAVTPDGLAGSYAGTKNLDFYILDSNYNLVTGDGKMYTRIPSDYNGMDIVSASCGVNTTSSSGTPTIQLARGRQANATSAHSYVDVLSTRITIDASEYDSKDATTSSVVDTSNDDVATGDMLRWDLDVTGTGTKGLICNVALRLP